MMVLSSKSKQSQTHVYQCYVSTLRLLLVGSSLCFLALYFEAIISYLLMPTVQPSLVMVFQLFLPNWFFVGSLCVLMISFTIL